MKLARNAFWWIGLISLWWSSGCDTRAVSFNADIRPIINEQCASCHGGVKKNGGISLLTREDALAVGESGLRVIVPGKPDSSELYLRLIHPHADMRMPLEKDPLSKDEIELFRKWIEQGAPWEKHWAFVPLTKPATFRGIDRYVQDRLQIEGLEAAPQAHPAQLIRRLSLDLIGLPPQGDFSLPHSGNWEDSIYHDFVNSLLASPHFGEKWASMWLDLARYADSQGYQKDRFRSIWAYRDWVIEALNRDLPFDQFTIEQLAGDLLEQPDTSQLIATAFHRNTMSNDEGGTDNEEFRVAAVIDRVNTTFEVWQGITMGCVQCHDHPYDPFPQQDFYQIYAYFDQSADADYSSDHPVLTAFSPVQKKQKDQLVQWLNDWEGAADDSLFVHRTQLAHSLVPTRTPIMQELPDSLRRTTRLFERGNWLVHGPEMFPLPPAALSMMPDSFPANRLGLAQWLVHPDNPLTARVFVNRIWEQLFGQGLVPSLEDFGAQGSKPVHQALLDELAWRFMHVHQWSIKALIKEIILSDTYRRAATGNEQSWEQDPANQFYSRGPRFRLSAEQIRDQVLAVSGLLNLEMYGPSVMPPQPEGVWQVIRHVLRWKTSPGTQRYRRAIYTFSRRSSPYPPSITFDAPSRELCVSRRIRTNTPLQALVTLNDSIYHEAAWKLSLTVASELEEQDATSMVQALYHRCFYTKPSPDQVEILRHLYRETKAAYEAAPELLLAFGQGADVTASQAAWAQLTLSLFNTDAFLNKT